MSRQNAADALKRSDEDELRDYPFFWADHAEESGDEFDHRRQIPFWVRVKENKEFVGVVLAESYSALCCTIDEICDPGVCEVAVLPQGGGILFGVGMKPHISEIWMAYQADGEAREEGDEIEYVPSGIWHSPIQDERTKTEKIADLKTEAADLRSIITSLGSLTCTTRQKFAKKCSKSGKKLIKAR